MDNKLKVSDLLLDCAKHPEVYNEISTKIYELFGIRSAESSLLVTWFILNERGLLNDR